jgi:hypothetical protein
VRRGLGMEGKIRPIEETAEKIVGVLLNRVERSLQRRR